MKLIGVILSLMAFTVCAENTYFGAGYHFGTYDETNAPEASPKNIKIELGTYVAENVAIEGHVLMNPTDDRVTVFGADVDVEVKHAFSVFAKGDIPISDDGKFYGLIGFSKGKLEASGLGASFSDDDSGMSYGLGFEIHMGDRVYLSGEHILYLSESDYDYSGFNIGIHGFY